MCQVAGERVECKKLSLWTSAEEFDGKRVPRCNLPVFIASKRNLTGKSMFFFCDKLQFDVNYIGNDVTKCKLPNLKNDKMQSAKIADSVSS
jgi:hypothetical protein